VIPSCIPAFWQNTPRSEIAFLAANPTNYHEFRSGRNVRSGMPLSIEDPVAGGQEAPRHDSTMKRKNKKKGNLVNKRIWGESADRGIMNHATDPVVDCGRTSPCGKRDWRRSDRLLRAPLATRTPDAGGLSRPIRRLAHLMTQHCRLHPKGGGRSKTVSGKVT